MSLKCSIFGHRFGDPVVDRSRDESGSEVVITIQEIQTCGRCGRERVVSENKEVTTLETPDDVPAEPAPTEDAESTQSTSTAPEPTPPPDEGATILEDEDPVVQEAEPDADDPPTADDLTEPPAEEPSSTEDDGIILEEEESTEPEREPGEWPEEPGDEEPEWEPPTDVTAEADLDPDPEPSPSVEPTGEAVTVPEGTFRCPNCGFSTPVESSSLRAGDFCPECHTGSLAHESE